MRPTWVTETPEGWVGAWGTSGRDRVAAVGILGLTVFWTVCTPLFGVATGGVACVMGALLLVLWPLSVGMVWTMTDRFELELGADALRLARWRYGRRTEQRWALEGLRVESRSIDGSRGVTHVFLDLRAADGSTACLALPAGTSLKDRPRTKEELAWVVGAIRARGARPPRG